MKTKIDLVDALELLLSYKGTIYGSKSLSDPLTIHNSNLVVKNKVLWYGDINIDKSGKKLCQLAILYGITIEIYHESPIRQFNFDNESQKQIEKKQAGIIKITEPVWTTSNTKLFANLPIDEVRAKQQKILERNILNRQIYLGFLTPNGTQWTWYNKIYYAYIHIICRILKGNYNTFITSNIIYSNYKDLNLIGKIKFILSGIKKEFGYFKIEVKENNASYWNLFIGRYK